MSSQGPVRPLACPARFERATHAIEGLATSSEDGLVLGEFANVEDKDWVW